MSMLERIKGAFRREAPEAPSRLRNKAGGMAWVLSEGLHSGAESLAGSAVKTVLVQPNGMWLIEPVLGYIATAPQKFPDGTQYLPGQAVFICAIADEALQPWQEDSGGVTEAEVLHLYSPNKERSPA